MTETKEKGEWRSKCTSVAERWTEARKKGLFTDVSFLVGEGESIKSFSAHKNVLAFSSPVFEAMFFGTLAEKKNPISIVDIDPEAFNALLRFAYGEKITFSSVAYAAKTYIAADKYLVADLKAEAEDYISKSDMDAPQFWDLITQDKFFHIPIVKKKCLEYLASHTSAVFESYLFVNVSAAVIEGILQMKEIQISEIELLSVLFRWAVGNVQADVKLRRKLEEHLRYIHSGVGNVEEYALLRRKLQSVLRQIRPRT